MKGSNIPFILAIVGTSAVALWASDLVQPARAPTTAPIAQLPPEVRVISARRGTHRGQLIGYGETRARYDLQLTAQVSGRVTSVDDGVESGRTVTPDQVLFRIDDTPFRMALAEAKQSRADAELKLVQEQGQADRAKAEWASAELNIPASPLVFREPQLTAAKTAIAAASARVENARNDLTHTRVVAPFPALVVERLVGPGDFVTSGMPLAHLVSLDRVEVRVPLSGSQWSIIDDTVNGPVRISTQSGSEHWSGYVLRTERHVNNENRQRALVIAVDEPLKQEPPLYPGTFVAVEVPSRPIESAYRLPASALSTDGYLWQITSDNRAERFKPLVHYKFNEHIVAVPPDTVADASIVVKPLASLTRNTLVEPLRSPSTDELAIDLMALDAGQ